MRHNSHSSDFQFYQNPVPFDKFTKKELLQFCLGATLYMPGTKRITDKILSNEIQEMASMVMCFEDAIALENLAEAEDNVLSTLDEISKALKSGALHVQNLPLIFLRVRNLNQFICFSEKLDSSRASTLSGFVFPKFSSDNAIQYLRQLENTSNRLGTGLYGMPILEGKAIAYREHRLAELEKLRVTLEPFQEIILNIRVGGTDFSSLFGVRRGINSSIYDILPVRDCLSDILNFFNREETNYTVSAPVWEYFLADKGEDLRSLLDGAFHQTLLNRNTIINPAVDGLLREVSMDISNGFIGKTIIHPSHLRFVNSMQAVTREEFEDAQQILQNPGGVVKSAKANKMNEINPHTNWAKRISLRASAYGVIEDESEYLKLMQVK